MQQLAHAVLALGIGRARPGFWSLCCASSSACLAQTSRPVPRYSSRERPTETDLRRNLPKHAFVWVFVQSRVPGVGGLFGGGWGLLCWIAYEYAKSSVDMKMQRVLGPSVG